MARGEGRWLTTDKWGDLGIPLESQNQDARERLHSHAHQIMADLEELGFGAFLSSASLLGAIVRHSRAHLPVVFLHCSGDFGDIFTAYFDPGGTFNQPYATRANSLRGFGLVLLDRARGPRVRRRSALGDGN